MELAEFSLRYDKYGDVLYVTTPTNRPALTDEDDVGLLWRYSTDNGELVGVTILDYGAYWKSHREDLAGRISDHFHVPAGEVEKLLPDVEPA
jgi:hypothetical protein